VWKWFRILKYFHGYFSSTALTALSVVFWVMKTTDAFYFFLVGLGMFFSPAYWPDSFSAAPNGANTSELWLILMGTAQMLLGAWLMGLNVVPRLMHTIAEWEPVPLNFEMVDVGWVLPESFYVALEDADEVSVGLNLQRQLRLGYA